MVSIFQISQKTEQMTDMEIMLELGMSRASFYRKKKAALRYLGYYFLAATFYFCKSHYGKRKALPWLPLWLFHKISHQLLHKICH